MIYVSLALTIISLLDYVIKNKDVLKEVKEKGAFMYLNHTQTVADAYIPNTIAFLKSLF